MRAMAMRVAWVACAACSLAACSTQLGGAGPATGAVAGGGAPVTEATLDDLAMLATGRRPSPDERRKVLAAIESGETSLEAHVKRLLADQGFARVVAPQVLLGYLTAAPFSFDIPALKSATIDGVVVHYRRQPCKSLAEAEDVSPWWDLRSKIKICRDDHRPALLKDGQGRYCHGASGSVIGMECGCGPNLIFCAADNKHKQQIMWSLRQESVETIAYIVEHDLPLTEVFTTGHSFRDRTAAWSHYRDQIVNGVLDKMPDLSGWPAGGQWAPRPEVWPGQHAGIMTNLHLAYMSDGPRDRMRFYYERGWCVSPTSFGVEVERFRTLVHGAQDLRYHQARWKELAAAPGCTTCHARLDYGMQFFLGYQDFLTAMGPTLATSKQLEEGRLYGDDIGDDRGAGRLTPRAFGELLVSQREFGTCMVEHVNRHVFGGAASLEQRDLLREDFRRTGTMQALMASALVLYVRDGRRAGAPASDAPARPGQAGARTAGPDVVALSAELAKLLEQHCRDCHDQGERDFLAKLGERPALARSRVLSMLDLTAFELMPKGPHRLSAPERRAMLTEMIRSLGLGEEGEANARAYFLGDGFRGSRAHFIDASRASIADTAGYRRQDAWPWVVESELEGALVTVTPGLIMQLAQTAMEACKAIQEAGPREACLTRALDPELYLAR